MSTTLPHRRPDLAPADDGSPGGPGRSFGQRLLGRRRLLAVLAAGALVLVVFATWLVAFSSAFGVRSVEVRGEHSLTTGEIEARARIVSGTPLVRVDTAAITARVESLPEVQRAEVSTSFPSTVTITVVERTPVGYVADHGTFRLLDRT
ncbi:cell division protein FtsQ/DivIB, partial [Jatrophihabitans endophyticus]|uniref:cell division protein FtsQ/DivIB n=1 Tax=Jatrophihabitans endophyticus TaxID=1206085 RepID=UPI0019EFB061